MQPIACPLDYSLCRQTVTIYRNQDGAVLRQVVDGCFFQLEQKGYVDATGCRREKKFLLIVPGTQQCVFVGDRVMEGVGPEVSPEEWGRFLPALVDGLVEVFYAAPYCWEDTVCHVEAGGGR